MNLKSSFLILYLLLLNCSSDGSYLKIVSDLPYELNEISGIEKNSDSNIIWAVNDSGNKSLLYGLNSKGDIIKTLILNAKNRDWEDLTIDDQGNIYIGNFGNNRNDSKNLNILKVSKKDLNSEASITPEIISFEYPEQKKFPPEKSKRNFDCEAFFYLNDSLYLFTKSRSPNNYGLTNLYSLPAKKGEFKAKFINSFNTCSNKGCWVTSVDINEAKNKIALLTEHHLFLISNFKNRNFFQGDIKQLTFDYKSQKESICFKNDSILYVADENQGFRGGNLYELKIN